MYNMPGGGGGYSPKIPIRVCAAQRGRDFGTPYLERGIHFRGCLHGGRKILVPGRSEKAEKLFVCFTCRNFGRSGYQVEKEKKNNCRP